MARPRESLLTRGLVEHASTAFEALEVSGAGRASVLALLNAARDAVEELKYLRAEAEGLRQAVDYYNGVAPGKARRRG